MNEPNRLIGDRDGGGQRAEELRRFGEKLRTTFGLDYELKIIHPGIMGAEASVPPEQYNLIKAYLTGRFGEPVIQECWLSDQTKKRPPLTWHLQDPPYKELERMDHINLVSYMQQPAKYWVRLWWT